MFNVIHPYFFRLEIDPFRIRYKVSKSEMLINHEDILLTSRLPATPIPQLHRRSISTSYGRKR